MSAPDRPRASRKAVINSLLLLLAFVVAIVLFFVYGDGIVPLTSHYRGMPVDRWLI